MREERRIKTLGVWWGKDIMMEHTFRASFALSLSVGFADGRSITRADIPPAPASSGKFRIETDDALLLFYTAGTFLLRSHLASVYIT